MIAALVALASCGGSENAGAAEAKAEREAETAKKKATEPPPPPQAKPPVPGRAKLKCENVIDSAAYTEALGEKDPLVLVASKEPEAAASCSLMRGGKRPSEAEQKKLLKDKGRLGVLAGDEVCNVAVFCWTIEDPDRFMKKCLEGKDQDDASLGFHACVHIVATGEADVKRFRFFDDDTRCLIQVRAGPSNVDNDVIGKCAKTAHDQIGPAQIAVKP